MDRVIITIENGTLTVAATPMSLADLNLWLDVAKRQLLEQGQVDEVIEEPVGVE